MQSPLHLHSWLTLWIQSLWVGRADYTQFIPSIMASDTSFLTTFPCPGRSFSEELQNKNAGQEKHFAELLSNLYGETIL